MLQPGSNMYIQTVDRLCIIVLSFVFSHLTEWNSWFSSISCSTQRSLFFR